MKHLRLVGLESEREALLRALQDMGCVEVSGVDGAEDALQCTLDLQTLYDYLALRQVPGSFCDSADAARNELLVRYFLRLADVNEDGQVDILDYQALYTTIRAEEEAA